LRRVFTNGEFQKRIIIGSDRRPETKQEKIVRFRSGRVRDRVRDSVRVRDSDLNEIADLNLTPCFKKFPDVLSQH